MMEEEIIVDLLGVNQEHGHAKKLRPTLLCPECGEGVEAYSGHMMKHVSDWAREAIKPVQEALTKDEKAWRHRLMSCLAGWHDLDEETLQCRNCDYK